MQDFEFKGFHNIDSSCGVDIYHRTDGKVVVVLTELPENEGTSVTNAVELIAEQVVNSFSLEEKDIIWVEHYPEVSDGNKMLHEDTFDLVEMEVSDGHFYSPSWKRLSRIEFAKLISV